jgi:uncharacterized protein (UPF0332 family)
VIDPSGLLKVAHHLAEEGQRSREATDGFAEACLRRSVSTAYYAVFHNLLAAGAQRFMGPDQQKRPGAAILYRGFAHTQVRSVCDALQSPVLKERFQNALGKASVSKDMRDFATAFTELQDHRHGADYDPRLAFERMDVKSILSLARFAIAAFDRADAAERADVLALLLVGARG